MQSLDYETALIRPGLQAPPVVCAVVAGANGTTLHPTASVESATRAALREGVCGVNIAYDMACAIEWHPLLPAVLEAYEAGRIIDLSAFRRVAEISGLVPKAGSYALENLCRQAGIPTPPKDDGVRLSFGPLWGEPLSAYSPAQLDYLRGDGDAGYLLYEQYCNSWADRLNMADVAMLSRDLFWLRLIANYGIRTDPAKLDDLETAAHLQLAALNETAQEIQLLPGRQALKGEHYFEKAPDGFWRLRKVGTRDSTLAPGAYLPPQQLPHRADFKTAKQYEAALDELRPVGLDGKINKAQLQALVSQAYALRPPLTVRGKDASPSWQPSVSTSSTTLEDSDDPLLLALHERGQWASLCSEKGNTGIGMLRSGATRPIHTRFNLADTTRTTSSAPNVQNWRSKKYTLAGGQAVGMRECVIPRAGWCFVGADYPTLEMRTLAQVIVNRHRSWDLADQINQQHDIHCVTAQFFYPHLTWSQIKELCRTDKAVASVRQRCKIPNFGCPGGLMKPATLKAYARNGGMQITEKEARDLIAAVRSRQPDIPLYLDGINSLPRSGEGYSVQIPGCTIVRRNARYTSAANTGFQGLAARIAGRVGWQLAKECLTPGTALFGCRLVLFIHDEFILECPIGRQTEAAQRLVAVMRDYAIPLLPDIDIGEPDYYAAACWSKDAARIETDGNLEIWVPE